MKNEIRYFLFTFIPCPICKQCNLRHSNDTNWCSMSDSIRTEYIKVGIIISCFKSLQNVSHLLSPFCKAYQTRLSVSTESVSSQYYLVYGLSDKKPGKTNNFPYLLINACVSFMTYYSFVSRDIVALNVKLWSYADHDSERYFFSVRLVGSAWSFGLFIPATTANDLRLWRIFLSQILSITFIFLS